MIYQIYQRLVYPENNRPAGQVYWVGDYDHLPVYLNSYIQIFPNVYMKPSEDGKTLIEYYYVVEESETPLKVWFRDGEFSFSIHYDLYSNTTYSSLHEANIRLQNQLYRLQEIKWLVEYGIWSEKDVEKHFPSFIYTEGVLDKLWETLPHINPKKLEIEKDYSDRELNAAYHDIIAGKLLNSKYGWYYKVGKKYLAISLDYSTYGYENTQKALEQNLRQLYKLQLLGQIKHFYVDVAPPDLFYSGWIRFIMDIGD